MVYTGRRKNYDYGLGSSMHWILQLDLEAGHAEEAMLDAIKDLSLPHTCVKVVPFSHELIPEPKVDPEDQVVCYGGIGLKSIAAERNWNPGIYLNENFVFERWLENWGDRILNADSIVTQFDSITLQSDPFFVRPCATDKTFTGVVVTQAEYAVWREEINQGTTSQFYQGLTPDTLVASAPYKKIDRECRFFCVDDRIVTASFYRSRFEHKYIAFYGTPWYDAAMERYVLEHIRKWHPDRAYVLDVAQCENEYKIIEVNCYNSSGLYECDPIKVVEAIEEIG